MAMRIIQAADYKDMSRKAANILSAQILMKPDCVLGLATGSTPIGTYDQLVEWYLKGDLDFKDVRTFNLDEYVGLPGTSAQSYSHFMHRHLFDRVDISPEHTFFLDGMETNGERECREYDRKITAAGGIDLQLLGLGHDGHIGFNEPGTAFEMGTHPVTLKEDTIKANSRFFGSTEAVPKQAYTMGIRSIMQALRILIIVSGEDKADIAAQAFTGPVRPEVPASILQLHHDVIVAGDEAALSKCRF
jgi:glucosamine-6-phosphate deaminase